MPDILDAAQKQINDAANKLTPPAAAGSAPPPADPTPPAPPPQPDPTPAPPPAGGPAAPPAPAPEPTKPPDPATSEPTPEESAFVDKLIHETNPVSEPPPEPPKPPEPLAQGATPSAAEGPPPTPPKKKGTGRGAMIAAVLLLLFALPMGVFFVSQQQKQLTDTRSRAAEQCISALECSDTGNNCNGCGSGWSYRVSGRKCCKQIAVPTSTTAPTPTSTRAPTPTPTTAPAQVLCNAIRSDARCVYENELCDNDHGTLGCGEGRKCCSFSGPTPTRLPTPTRAPTPTPTITTGYCDRSSPNTADCIDKTEGTSCTRRPSYGGGTGTCRIINPGGANSECECRVGGSGPTRTPTGSLPSGGQCPSAKITDNCAIYECPGGCSFYDNGALPECRTFARKVPCSQAAASGCGQVDYLDDSGNYCGVKPGTQCTNGTNSCGGGGGGGGGEPTPTTPPRVLQCRAISIYKDETKVTDYATLKSGDAVVLAVKGDNATKGRFRVNGAPPGFTESTGTNTAGEFTVNFTIPNDIPNNSITIEAEVFQNGVWK